MPWFSLERFVPMLGLVLPFFLMRGWVFLMVELWLVWHYPQFFFWFYLINVSCLMIYHVLESVKVYFYLWMVSLIDNVALVQRAFIFYGFFLTIAVSIFKLVTDVFVPAVYFIIDYVFTDYISIEEMENFKKKVLNSPIVVFFYNAVVITYSDIIEVLFSPVLKTLWSWLVYFKNWAIASSVASNNYFVSPLSFLWSMYYNWVYNFCSWFYLSFSLDIYDVKVHYAFFVGALELEFDEYMLLEFPVFMKMFFSCVYGIFFLFINFCMGLLVLSVFLAMVFFLHALLLLNLTSSYIQSCIFLIACVVFFNLILVCVVVIIVIIFMFLVIVLIFGFFCIMYKLKFVFFLCLVLWVLLSFLDYIYLNKHGKGVVGSLKKKKSMYDKWFK